MASSKEYLTFILEQLKGMPSITYRPMMGEYLLYYEGLLFGGIYDDRLLLKKLPLILSMKWLKKSHILMQNLCT